LSLNFKGQSAGRASVREDLSEANGIKTQGHQKGSQLIDREYVEKQEAPPKTLGSGVCERERERPNNSLTTVRQGLPAVPTHPSAVSSKNMGPSQILQENLGTRSPPFSVPIVMLSNLWEL
jgi:hypothetical protein